jgi:hypothetical protein
LPISDCSGSGCMDAVAAALQAANVTAISDCSDVKGLTYGGAKQRGALPGGGALLAFTGLGGPNAVACAETDYDSSLACCGVGYKCWKTDKTASKPVGRMMDYLDKFAARGPSDEHFMQAQAVWQESAESVVIGTLRNSSLVTDERNSGLNALLVEQVKAGRWDSIGILEVNDVCDPDGSGPALLAALRARFGRQRPVEA